MTTSFKILFMIEVLHDFYNEGKCTDFRFIPSRQTEILLKNYHAFCKTVGNKFVVLMKSDENGKPFISPKPTDRFTFFKELMNPVFMTVSGLELSSLADKRFYFTNLHQNKATASGKDWFYLTKRIDDFQNATNYSPGDFAKQAGVIYECIKSSTNNPVTEKDFWHQRETNQYATKNDLLKYITDVQTFSVSPASASVNISVFGLNTVSQQFDMPLLQQTFTYEAAVSECTVDLSSLPEAKYRIEINGNELFVYMSNDAVYKNVFAVIDLYNHLPDGNEFAFTDAAGKLKDQVVAAKNVWLNYTLRFANRLAFWKYIVPQKKVKAVSGSSDYSFSSNVAGTVDCVTNPADYFLSTRPVPLKEIPYDFKLEPCSLISNEDPPAPHPDIHAPGMITKNGESYYCTIYLNY